MSAAPPEALRVDPRSEEIRRNNRALLLKLGAVAVAMFGFGYALVPFYEKICEVTGLRRVSSASNSTRTSTTCRGSSARSKGPPTFIRAR